MRGRLIMAGVGPKTPISDALDVLTVIVMDTPGEALQKWRTGMVARAQTTVADSAEAYRQMRATWGLQPHQIEAHKKFHQRMGGGG
jgi:hypothetical protein